jgi:hypothetical protein
MPNLFFYFSWLSFQLFIFIYCKKLLMLILQNCEKQVENLSHFDRSIEIINTVKYLPSTLFLSFVETCDLTKNPYHT